MIAAFSPGNYLFRSLHWKSYEIKSFYGPSWVWAGWALGCKTSKSWWTPFRDEISNKVKIICVLSAVFQFCLILIPYSLSFLKFKIDVITHFWVVDYRETFKPPILIRSGGGIRNYLYQLISHGSAQPKVEGSNILGKLQITWRTNLGEPGRLQTQQIMGTVSLSFLT